MLLQHLALWHLCASELELELGLCSQVAMRLDARCNPSVRNTTALLHSPAGFSHHSCCAEHTASQTKSATCRSLVSEVKCSVASDCRACASVTLPAFTARESLEWILPLACKGSAESIVVPKHAQRLEHAQVKEGNAAHQQPHVTAWYIWTFDRSSGFAEQHNSGARRRLVSVLYLL